MNIRIAIFLLAAASFVSAYAQTNYEKIEIGSIVQSSIGIGTFVKPIPIPPGEWLLVSKYIDEKNLTSNKGDSVKLTYVWMTLKNNKIESGPISAFVLSFTPDSSNINYVNGKCESSNQKVLVDDFGTNPNSLLYLCGNTNAWPSFKKTLSSASGNTNSWFKNNFTALAAYSAEMPDEILMRTVTGNKFKGRSVSYTFVTRRDGVFPSDPAYAKYATDWTHSDGLTLNSVLNNNDAKFSTPESFAHSN
jgi:hypothetical protein